MSRKIIKAGSITNLTDARFFAAYDVDYMGFCFDPLSPDYISPQNALAIKGWISGPKFVAEFANQDLENVKNIIEFFEPDVIQIKGLGFGVSGLGLPVIIKTTVNEINTIAQNDYLFLLVDDIAGLQKEQFHLPIMFDITGKFIDPEEEFIHAIQIKGSHELEVGIKDYNDIAELLERLRS